MIRNLLKKLVLSLPLKNYVIFESIPDLADNTMPVFEEMLRRGLNRKYKFVWLVSDKKKPFPKYENTVYIDTNTRKNRLEYQWYVNRAKCLVYCNRWIEKRRDDQFGVYLTHGTAVKKTGEYHLGNINYKYDFVTIDGEGSKDFMVEAIKGEHEKFVALGFPRNDVLLSKAYDLKKVFGSEFQKIVVWYPTFRQHKNGMKTASANSLPILHDADKAKRLNEMARECGVLLLIKPHFAQDVSYIKNENLSNLRFIDDAFFTEHQMTSYGFVGSCDGMITDYSSIYFDYLLCDKPVAAVWEDIEEYRQNPGFSIDVDFYLKGAEKIYDLDDFEVFLKNLAEDRDVLKKERDEISQLVNFARDTESTRRVTDFIIEKANL